MRHWVTAFGVDGFRIDLASVLGRPRSGPFDPHAPLLTAIATDPVLSRCKLIAEPWDATGEGYRVGGFPVAWSEWNGRYRDAVRDFWRGHGGDRRAGVAADRQLRPLRGCPGGGRGRRSTSSPRTTASPCATSSPTSASTTRPTARTTATAPTTTARRTSASRARPTSPVVRARRLGRGPGAARHAAAVDGHADAAGRRRAVAHPGRQQQRLLPRRRRRPGWTGPALPEAASLTAFVARLVGDPPVVGDAAPRPLLPRRRRARGGTSPGRPWTTATGTTTAAHRSACCVGEWLLLLHAGDAAPCTLPPGRPVRAGGRQHPRRRHAGELPPAAGRRDDHRSRRARCCSCAGTSRRPSDPRVGTFVSASRHVRRRESAVHRRGHSPRYPPTVPRYDFRCRQCSDHLRGRPPHGRRGRPGALPVRATRTRSSCSAPSPSAAGPAAAARPWPPHRPRPPAVAAAAGAAAAADRRPLRAATAGPTGSGTCAHGTRRDVPTIAIHPRSSPDERPGRPTLDGDAAPNLRNAE